MVEIADGLCLSDEDDATLMETSPSYMLDDFAHGLTIEHDRDEDANVIGQHELPDDERPVESPQHQQRNRKKLQQLLKKEKF